jgi:hypothetical protein
MERDSPPLDKLLLLTNRNTSERLLRVSEEEKQSNVKLKAQFKLHKTGSLCTET